jgi:GWxTD domain-containing protein
MNKLRLSLIALTILFALCLVSDEKLSPQHQEWLSIVSPIITSTERDIFLKLKNDGERDKFIQFFWKQRDPEPGTTANEFYQEYMKRVQFADRNFGRSTARRGSLTEQGYYYLLLGPPLERQIFTTHSQLYPLELWYCRGEERYGIPPYFYLIFYQPQGLGEYRLYNPGVEGPERLVTPVLYGQTTDRSTAYNAIKKVSAELANASLSYLPSQSVDTMASFSSDTIIASIRRLPEKKFSDAYARSYLQFKDFVETDYADNFIESNSKVKVLKSGGQPFVHWSVEPAKVNFVSLEGRNYAEFELILRLEDASGNPVLENTETIPLQVTPEQYKKYERRYFAIQNVFPVIPGKFKMFFLMKNKTARDFTSFSTEVNVPAEPGLPALSDLFLYPNWEKVPEAQANNVKAFVFEGSQCYFNTRNEFLPKKDLHLYFQVYNLDEKLMKAASVQVEVRSFPDDAVVLSQKKALREVQLPGAEGIHIGPLSLASFEPGYYQAEVLLVDDNAQRLASQKENFIILTQAYNVLPWVYSRLHPTFPGAEHLYLLGSQRFMTRDYPGAKKTLEQALRLKDEPAARLLLGKTLLALGEFQNSLTLLSPVYQAGRESEAAKVIALNYVGLKDWTSALIYLEELLKQATEVSVLNLAAECYLNLRQPDRAAPLLKKSLELNPNQPAIKALIEKIK